MKDPHFGMEPPDKIRGERTQSIQLLLFLGYPRYQDRQTLCHIGIGTFFIYPILAQGDIEFSLHQAKILISPNGELLVKNSPLVGLVPK
jgi:hypothetical protein